MSDHDEFKLSKKRLRNKKISRRIISFAVIIFGVTVIYAVLVPWLLQDSHMSSSTNDASSYELNHPDVVNVVSSIENFETKSMRIDYQMTFAPGPDSEIGSFLGTTTVVAQGKDFVVYIDDLKSRVEHQFRGLSMNGSIHGSVNAKPFYQADISHYPFDAYHGEILVRSKFVTDWNVSPYQLNPEAAPQLIHQYAYGVNPPEGFRTSFIRVSRASIFEDSKKFDHTEIQDDITRGFYYTTVLVERNNIVKFVVVLMAIFFLIIPVVSLLLLYFVHNNHRPPTLSALVWSNSLIFTLIATRFALPQNPPIGINLDKYLIFPAIIMTTIASLGHVIFWIRKENFIAK
jgi:hypothetical protein